MGAAAAAAAGIETAMTEATIEGMTEGMTDMTGATIAGAMAEVSRAAVILTPQLMTVFLPLAHT